MAEDSMAIGAAKSRRHPPPASVRNEMGHPFRNGPFPGLHPPRRPQGDGMLRQTAVVICPARSHGDGLDRTWVAASRIRAGIGVERCALADPSRLGAALPSAFATVRRRCPLRYEHTLKPPFKRGSSIPGSSRAPRVRPAPATPLPSRRARDAVRLAARRVNRRVRREPASSTPQLGRRGYGGG
jgi:hypothetical protein